jgi:hypothetical protein
MSVCDLTTKMKKMNQAVEKAANFFCRLYTSMGFDYDSKNKLWYFWIRRRLEGADYVARFPISSKEIDDQGYRDKEFQKRFEKFCVAAFEADITQVKDGRIDLELEKL